MAAPDLVLSPEDLTALDKATEPRLIYPFWHHLASAADRLSAGDRTLFGPPPLTALVASLASSLRASLAVLSGSRPLRAFETLTFSLSRSHGRHSLPPLAAAAPSVGSQSPALRYSTLAVAGHLVRRVR